MNELEVLYTVNADIEEPKCSRCDYITNDEKCKNCGPEHGWYNYLRTVYLKDKDEEILK